MTVNPLLRADSRTRTGDPRITNALLYQLSHIGNCGCKGKCFFPKNQKKTTIFLLKVIIRRIKFGKYQIF